MNDELDFKPIGISEKDIQQLGFGLHSISDASANFLPPPLPNHPDYIRSEGNEMTKNIYGINHRQTPLAVLQNKDQYGLTFFTRPQLNLSSNNLRKNRLFSRLLTETEVSIFRYIRNTLDPRLESSFGAGNPELEYIQCPLVDPYQAFIPILTNNLTNISGWPDIRSDTYTSKAGPYKEEWSIVDGLSINYSAYDLTATWRNSRGDPITQLFYYWTMYASNVFEGIMEPYTDFIINNEIDYNTRIYRLVLDPSKRYVQRIGACGASFPYAVPYSNVFDFDASKPYHEGNNEIQVPFKCMGAIYDDDILIRAFNTVVGYFNPYMKVGRDFFKKPDSVMKKIPIEHLKIFNNRGYPRINPDTRELEWYISEEIYNTKIKQYQEFNELLNRNLAFNIR